VGDAEDYLVRAGVEEGRRRLVAVSFTALSVAAAYLAFPSSSSLLLSESQFLRYQAQKHGQIHKQIIVPPKHPNASLLSHSFVEPQVAAGMWVVADSI